MAEGYPALGLRAGSGQARHVDRVAGRVEVCPARSPDRRPPAVGVAAAVDDEPPVLRSGRPAQRPPASVALRSPRSPDDPAPAGRGRSRSVAGRAARPPGRRARSRPSSPAASRSRPGERRRCRCRGGHRPSAGGCHPPGGGSRRTAAAPACRPPSGRTPANVADHRTSSAVPGRGPVAGRAASGRCWSPTQGRPLRISHGRPHDRLPPDLGRVARDDRHRIGRRPPRPARARPRAAPPTSPSAPSTATARPVAVRGRAAAGPRPGRGHDVARRRLRPRASAGARPPARGSARRCW